LINILKADKMGHIKEPTGIDFVIKSEPLTKEQEAAISKYIREYKTNHIKAKPVTRKKLLSKT